MGAAEDILYATVGPELAQRVHGSRGKGVVRAAGDLVRGRRLSLTGLGRSSDGRSTVKASIKRVDRLLGNAALTAEVPVFLKSLASLVLGVKGKSILLVDWTKIDDNFYALYASVSYHGRGIPIYFEVHPAELQNNPQVELDFLKGLAKVLPEGSKALIVSDAGFRVDWILSCRELGFDYVTRVPGYTKIRTESESWTSATDLGKEAGNEPVDMGPSLLAKSRSVQVRLIRGPKYNPTKKKAKPKKRKSKRTETKEKKRALETWMLATSLGQEFTSRAVIKIYKTRMQIEQNFRDKKNMRFGWSLRHARCSTAKRYTNLLLIALFATYALLLLGSYAESNKLHRKFQANTEKKHRVLSLVYLAQNIASTYLWGTLSEVHWLDESKLLKQKVESIIGAIMAEGNL